MIVPPGGGGSIALMSSGLLTVSLASYGSQHALFCFCTVCVATEKFVTSMTGHGIGTSSSTLKSYRHGLSAVFSTRNSNRGVSGRQSSAAHEPSERRFHVLLGVSVWTYVPTGAASSDSSSLASRSSTVILQHSGRPILNSVVTSNSGQRMHGSFGTTGSMHSKIGGGTGSIKQSSTNVNSTTGTAGTLQPGSEFLKRFSAMVSSRCL